MIILVHAETTEATIGVQLGRAEYSYYFVLKAFRPLLEQLGIVVPVSDPAREVDRIYHNAIARGESCLFLSFSPPHRTEVGLRCPTIPVFAWEFDSLPNEAWDADRRQDWVWALRRVGRAIVHSERTVEVVKAALGADFPVTCIPSPVWDRFEPSRNGSVPRSPADRLATLRIQGTVIDSQEVDFSVLSHDQDWLAWLVAHRAGQKGSRRVSLEGVVYTSVFNPEDGRKNWPDMVACFCRTFAREPRATLVLKLTHYDGTAGLVMMMRLLYRLAPFACRVVLMHGFLPEEDYAALVGVTAYVVNSAHGEGQCLPVMECMSAGKPAVAPAHSGMSDYITPDCAFVVASSEEPSFWPQDPRRATRTMRHRIDAASLNQAYRDSLRVALDAPDKYRAMSRAATQALKRHSSNATVKERLRQVLDSVLEGAPGVTAPVPADLSTGPRLVTSTGPQHKEIDMELRQRVAALAYFQDRPPPDLDDYVAYDPSDAAHCRILAEQHAFQCDATAGNFVLLHREAGKAPSNTPVRIRGEANALIVDRDCTLHGKIEMRGDDNLAIFEGSQGILAIGVMMYGHDTLIWGRGSTAWGLRVWLQGGTTCSVAEDCLMSENITIRSTDHHSIFDIDTGQQVNAPAGITIGKHVWIGQDCAVVKGVTIADGAIIGARSLVLGTIGAAELWAGSPARKLRERVSWTHSHPVMDPRERDQVLELLSLENRAP